MTIQWARIGKPARGAHKPQGLPELDVPVEGSNPPGSTTLWQLWILNALHRFNRAIDYRNVRLNALHAKLRWRWIPESKREDQKWLMHASNYGMDARRLLEHLGRAR